VRAGRAVALVSGPHPVRRFVRSTRVPRRTKRVLSRPSCELSEPVSRDARRDDALRFRTRDSATPKGPRRHLCPTARLELTLYSADLYPAERSRVCRGRSLHPAPGWWGGRTSLVKHLGHSYLPSRAPLPSANDQFKGELSSRSEKGDGLDNTPLPAVGAVRPTWCPPVSPARPRPFCSPRDEPGGRRRERLKRLDLESYKQRRNRGF
jgi:hypothetical protein